MDTKIDDGSPFTGSVISDNGECVDHDESGTKPTFAANNFGSGTASENNKDACLSRIIINRWFGRDMGLTTINSAGGGCPSCCSSCQDYGLGSAILSDCAGLYFGTYITSYSLPCSYSSVVSYLSHSSNISYIEMCDLTTTNSLTTLSATTWYRVCAPCATSNDCNPGATNTITYLGQTVNHSWSTACYIKSGFSQGYCAPPGNIEACSRICRTP